MEELYFFRWILNGQNVVPRALCVLCVFVVKKSNHEGHREHKEHEERKEQFLTVV